MCSLYGSSVVLSSSLLSFLSLGLSSFSGGLSRLSFGLCLSSQLCGILSSGLVFTGSSGSVQSCLLCSIGFVPCSLGSSLRNASSCLSSFRCLFSSLRIFRVLARDQDGVLTLRCQQSLVVGNTFLLPIGQLVICPTGRFDRVAAFQRHFSNGIDQGNGLGHWLHSNRPINIEILIFCSSSVST